MAKIYYRLVLSGGRTLESIPERWLTEVQALMESSTLPL